MAAYSVYLNGELLNAFEKFKKNHPWKGESEIFREAMVVFLNHAGYYDNSLIVVRKESQESEATL